MKFEYQKHQEYKAKKRNFFIALGMFYIAVFGLIIGASISKSNSTGTIDNVLTEAFKFGKTIDRNYMINYIERNKHKFKDVDINILAISLREAVLDYNIPITECKSVVDTIIRFEYQRRTPEYENAYIKLIGICI